MQAALAASDPLSRLGERLRLSQRCLDSILPLLPAGLRSQVRAGPIDEQGWALLVPNGAVSAKLRHCLPALLQRLADQGLAVRDIRVRILSEW